MKLQTFLFLILALAVILVYVFRDETVLVEDDNQKVIDSLKTELVIQKQEREKLAKEIVTLNESISTYQERIDRNQQQLKNLKKTYNEKMDSVRRMSHGDIQEYFTNRYKVGE
jgi:septal ring factor EnvC (AmiA/AmiB activator)